MADGKIVRKGGAVGTKAPSINFVSSTFDSITFTITNNDTATADIFWEVGDSTPDANTLSLASGATSSNQVVSGLTEQTSYTIFAFANVEGKAGSQTSTNVQTTPAEPIIYTAATGGTTLEYDSGGKRYKSHTFTSSGTFTVTTAGSGNRNQVDYLIIAGGGSGGGNKGGAGGGAGGYRTTLGTSGANSSAESKVVVTAQGYTVTIGAGGSQSNGENSSVFGITSTGGGKGGTDSASGSAGGSGGGGGKSFSGGGSGTTAQGFNGGNSPSTGGRGGGGGGGASEAGSNGQPEGNGGDGGDGLSNILRTGSNETRSGGGGGASYTTTGSGGSGGGADGGRFSATSAIANTGGGGGGVDEFGQGSNGGSGIVVIRYEIAGA